MQVEDQLLRDDEEARSHALDVTRSFIVQAPAGSGKTELLIQRYLRLLAIVSSPEEILAITFTRKAAAEMQVRILKALQGAADDIEPQAPHEKITARAARAALAADRDHGWNLLDNPRRMRIQTLDSLNATIARKQPVTAVGGASDNAIVADAEMHALYREAAALTLDQLAESGAFRDATRNVLVHVDMNVSLYVGYVSKMLQTRDQWLPFVGSGNLDAAEASTLREFFEAGLRRTVTRQLGLLAQSFPQEHASTLLELGRYAARNLAEGGLEAGAIETLDGLESLPRGSTGSLEAWKGIADLLLTAQGEYRKRLTKNQGFPAGKNDSKQAHADLVESLGRREEFAGLLHSVRLLPPLQYTDEQWRVLLALFNLLPLAVTELKRLFVERGLVDHIEIALSASDALGTPDEPGDVAMLLDYQVRHLLVDEMQDTSAAQYRMIEALTGGWEPGDGRTLYCVGDPMQSIYRFRNAEVGQFLISKEVGIGNIPLEALTLRRNFRSGEGLVDWFNSVFPQVMPDKDDHERSAVSYEAAVPVPQLSGLGTCSVYPVFGADKGAEAEVGIEVIEKLLDSESDGDIAVLVRGRSHLAELLRRLRTKGIGYRAVEIDRLTDLPEIIDALALTRAIVHHGDRHAWLALLRSPWVGLDWTDLHALVSGDRETVVWELIHDRARMDTLSASGRLAVERFRETLQPVMSTSRTDKLRDRVERAWFSLGGPWIPESPDSIDNIYHFFDVVENLEVAGDLPDVAELEEALDTEHVSSHSSSRLQVMTMHRAKGLQFDHVILFGLGRIPRPSEQGVMSWFDLPDEHGHPLKVISPIGPRSEVDKDAVHGYIGKVDAEMNDNELGRLLYVACTRARRSLHLVGNALVYKSGMRPHKRSLLHRLWPFVHDEYERQFDPDRSVPGDNSGDPWLVPQLRRFEQDWQVPEPLPLAVKPVSRAADDTAVEFQWVGSGARTAGTLVHRWLQFMVDGQLAADDIAERALRRESLRWAREMGVDDARAGPIVDRTIDALQKMLADDRGRWLLSGDGHAELALTGVIAGRTESVVLDRVKIDVDDVHWIIDYKTSTHEGGNLQRFLAEEVRRYEGQLAKYAELYQHYSGVEPRCALYFPLLQSFVEVEPASL